MTEASADATRDQRLVAAVNAIVDDATRQMARSIVVARGVERIRPILEGDERPAERVRRENAAALAQMAALGNTRDAAMQVARRWTSDPHTKKILAQRFRRLRRQKK
jgi:hypothetical protein